MLEVKTSLLHEFNTTVLRDSFSIMSLSTVDSFHNTTCSINERIIVKTFQLAVEDKNKPVKYETKVTDSFQVLSSLANANANELALEQFWFSL